MTIEQIYTGCLAQGAYYIESDGEAVVIDPLRDIKPYLLRESQSGSTIKYVFETHFHADFVSGHLDLAKATGATIVFGPTATPAFEAKIATDGEIFKVGKISFKVLHTPGHTMESCCYLLIDEQGKDIALFSGDTLFIGDVGRPDLAQKVKAELTEDLLANHLYDSLHNKIMPLADNVIVYPAHGAGSACGKNMSKETYDSLGHQKAVNYALQPELSKAQFVKNLLTGLTPPPAYFPLNVLLNIKGYDPIEEVMQRGLQELTADAFEVMANETGALILDTRDADIFAREFIPNAINIGLNGSFAPWAGAMIPDVKTQILLVAEPGKEEEVVGRLARVGYDYCLGFLKGGFASWKDSGKETDAIYRMDAAELASIMTKLPNAELLDVRKKSEYDSEHVEGAVNAPLDYINESMKLVDKNKNYFVYCAGGYRSMIFASILKARGYNRLIDIRGGFSAMKASNAFSLTDYVCPTTML